MSNPLLNPDKCDHSDTVVYMLDHEECEMYCKNCGSRREGHVAWGEWEKKEDE
jgi:hypothetical protein